MTCVQEKVLFGAAVAGLGLAVATAIETLAAAAAAEGATEGLATPVSALAIISAYGRVALAVVAFGAAAGNLEKCYQSNGQTVDAESVRRERERVDHEMERLNEKLKELEQKVH
jgi:hypothetical protein